MYVIYGYLTFLFMGIILGSTGAGGSIIALPILVYLFEIPILMATTYSLMIVGITSLFGVIIDFKKLPLNRALIFAIPSIITVFLVRYYLLSAMPNKIGDIELEQILSFAFAILAICCGCLLLRKIKIEKSNYVEVSYIKIIIVSILTAIITGLLGVGGGFIIVPSLILFLGFNPSESIITSLAIIALSAISGLISDIALSKQTLDIQFSIFAISASITGIICGRILRNILPNQKIKQGFGLIMILLGLTIIIMQILR